MEHGIAIGISGFAMLFVVIISYFRYIKYTKPNTDDTNKQLDIKAKSALENMLLSQLLIIIIVAITLLYISTH